MSTCSKFYDKSIDEVGFCFTAHFGGRNGESGQLEGFIGGAKWVVIGILTAKMVGKPKSDFTNRFAIKFGPCTFKDVYRYDICTGLA